MVKRSRNNNKTQVLLFNQPIENITKARLDFINSIIKKSNNQVQYVGEVHPADIDYPTTFAELSGKELTVEYHLFKYKIPDVPVVIRWRLNED